MEIKVEIQLSANVLNEYNKLRAIYPNMLIVICENGKATALYDDAFKMYDIVHDGTPLIFAAHPTSDRQRDMVPTYTIPEDDVDRHLVAIMKKVGGFLVSTID